MTNAQLVANCPKCSGQSCFPCNYAIRHTPWVYFAAVPDSATQPFSAFPTDYSKLPTISLVIPNLLNDMHWPRAPTNCPLDANDIPVEVAQGDAWLKTQLAAYALWAMTNNSLLIVTWDEDDYEGDPHLDCAAGQKYDWPSNQIATYIIGQPVKQGYTSQVVYNHHDLLNTILQMYGMPAVNGSSGAKVITDIWK
jgi:acid phosphatase